MNISKALSTVSDKMISTLQRLALLLVMIGVLEGLERVGITRHDAFTM